MLGDEPCPEMARIIRPARAAGDEYLLRVAQVLAACRDAAGLSPWRKRAGPGPPLPPVSIAVFLPVLAMPDGLPHRIKRVAAPGFQQAHPQEGRVPASKLVAVLIVVLRPG